MKRLIKQLTAWQKVDRRSREWTIEGFNSEVHITLDDGEHKIRKAVTVLELESFMSGSNDMLKIATSIMIDRLRSAEKT